MSVMLVKCVILLQHWRFFIFLFFCGGALKISLYRKTPALTGGTG